MQSFFNAVPVGKLCASVVINEVKYRTLVYILCAIFSVIGCSLVAKPYGAVGVAFAISFSLWMFNVFGMTLVYRKMIHFDVKSFIQERCLPVLPPLLIFTLVTSWLNSFLPDGLLWLAAKGFLWCILLGVVCFLFTFNHSERNYFKKKLMRRK